jgi:hypothetical protein
LHLPLEPPQRVFEGFTLLKSNFRHGLHPPTRPKLDSLVMASIAVLSQVDYEKIFILLKSPAASTIASVAEQMSSPASRNL